jgi:hypothetical protein
LGVVENCLTKSILWENLKDVMENICLIFPNLNPAQDADYQSQENDGAKVKCNCESLSRTNLGK